MEESKLLVCSFSRWRLISSPVLTSCLCWFMMPQHTASSYFWVIKFQLDGHLGSLFLLQYGFISFLLNFNIGLNPCLLERTLKNYTASMQLRAIKCVSRSKEWIFSFTFTQFHIKQRTTTTIRVEEFLQWKVVASSCNTGPSSEWAKRRF